MLKVDMWFRKFSHTNVTIQKNLHCNFRKILFQFGISLVDTKYHSLILLIRMIRWLYISFHFYLIIILHFSPSLRVIKCFRRMPSSGMLRHVALLRNDVSEERSASIIRVARTCELGILAVTSNWCSVRQLLVTVNVVPNSPIVVTLMMEVLHSSETSVLRRATWHNITEEGILHSHRHENLKS
jgi:hypothetical protein